jgi:DNA-binding CsgD family transcriptional regulator
LGITKWKRPRRNHPAKHEEIVMLRDHLIQEPTSEKAIRDRTLYGLMLFTGCRPGEARTALMSSIRSYGTGGCWEKGKTKNGENQDLPLPSQLMPWINAWKATRPHSHSPYLFPGQAFNQPLSEHMLRHRWHELRLMIGLEGLWNYDLRKTLPDVMGNELGYDYATIRAILNHTDHSSTGHYYFKSFNSLVKPMQHYADWLCGLRQDPVERQLLSILAPETDQRNSWSYSKPHPMDAWELPERQEPAPVLINQGVSIQVKPLPLEPEPSEIPPTLTAREREVLAWFAHGRSSPDIGARLGISYKTVQTHRARLLKKLKLTNTFQLSRYAIEHSRPVIAPAVVPMRPASMPTAYRSHSVEREEWPG